MKSNLILTRKENEVIQKMLEGKSNDQISKELEITVNTVKTHVARILKKKNVKNRIQLMSKQITNT